MALLHRDEPSGPLVANRVARAPARPAMVAAWVTTNDLLTGTRGGLSAGFAAMEACDAAAAGKRADRGADPGGPESVVLRIAPRVVSRAGL